MSLCIATPDVLSGRCTINVQVVGVVTFHDEGNVAGIGGYRCADHVALVVYSPVANFKFHDSIGDKISCR